MHLPFALKSENESSPGWPCFRTEKDRLRHLIYLAPGRFHFVTQRRDPKEDLTSVILWSSVPPLSKTDFQARNWRCFWSFKTCTSKEEMESLRADKWRFRKFEEWTLVNPFLVSHYSPDHKYLVCANARSLSQWCRLAMERIYTLRGSGWEECVKNGRNKNAKNVREMVQDQIKG